MRNESKSASSLTALLSSGPLPGRQPLLGPYTLQRLRGILSINASDIREGGRDRGCQGSQGSQWHHRGQLTCRSPRHLTAETWVSNLLPVSRQSQLSRCRWQKAETMQHPPPNKNKATGPPARSPVKQVELAHIKAGWGLGGLRLCPNLKYAYGFSTLLFL